MTRRAKILLFIFGCIMLVIPNILILFKYMPSGLMLHTIWYLGIVDSFWMGMLIAYINGHKEYLCFAFINAVVLISIFMRSNGFSFLYRLDNMTGWDRYYFICFVGGVAIWAVFNLLYIVALIYRVIKNRKKSKEDNPNE